MILFPTAKINLGLQVTKKRADGFHNIATVFYPIASSDVLEVISAENYSFTSSGLTIDATPDQNLCYKAYALLKESFDLPPVSIHLHKIIPMGAGLGGGSADGAFMLVLLNKLFQLGLPDLKLMELALRLGSDCPFFIRNTTAYATGRGELLEDLEIPDLAGKKIFLVNSGLHINTGWAFSQIIPRLPSEDLRYILSGPVISWKNNLKNDFEPAVFRAYPELQQLKDNFYKAGALYASMTGTGSTFFGIFDHLPDNPYLFFDQAYRLILA